MNSRDSKNVPCCIPSRSGSLNLHGTSYTGQFVQYGTDGVFLVVSFRAQTVIIEIPDQMVQEPVF